jgi:hypothetical protein
MMKSSMSAPRSAGVFESFAMRTSEPMESASPKTMSDRPSILTLIRGMPRFLRQSYGRLVNVVIYLS